MSQGYKLLIIDDFQLSALGTKALLAGYAMNFDIFTAFSVDEGLEILQKNPVDIVLCDIQMPEKDGFEALELIKTQYPATRVMFLTISDDKETLYKALAFGADGYQFKNVSKDELINSLKVVLTGSKYFNQRIINVLYDDLTIFAAGVLNNKLTPAYNVIQNSLHGNIPERDRFDKPILKKLPNFDSLEGILTSRESEILELVGHGASTKEIAAKLNISEFTVSTHRKNIYVKLGLETLTQMKQLAREMLASRNAG